MTRTKILTPAEGAALRKENKILKSKIQSLTKNLHNLGRGRIEFNNDSDSGRAKSDSDVKVEAFRLKLRERLMLPSSQFDDDGFEDSSQNEWSLKDPHNESSLVLGANDSESSCTNMSITSFDNNIRKKLNEEILSKQKELKHLIALTIKLRSNVQSQRMLLDKQEEQMSEWEGEKLQLCSQVQEKKAEKKYLDDITNLKNDLEVERKKNLNSINQIDKLEKENTMLRTQLSSIPKEKDLKKRKSIESNVLNLSEKKPRLSQQDLNHPHKPPLYAKSKNQQNFPDDFSAMSTLSISAIIDKQNRATNLSNNVRADDESMVSQSDSLTSEQRAIRIHAQNLLLWADRAIEYSSSSSRTSLDSNSVMSDLSSSKDFQKVSLLFDKENSNPNHKRDLKPNTKMICHSKKCSCCESIFSGRTEHVEFFLPKLGGACTCGAEPNMVTTDKTELSSFLRSWQVSFLNYCGITTAERLIEVNKHYAKPVARAMKKWRRKKKMKPAHTKSCLSALSIW